MRRVVKGDLSEEMALELNPKEPAGQSSNTQEGRPHGHRLQGWNALLFRKLEHADAAGHKARVLE